MCQHKQACIQRMQQTFQDSIVPNIHWVQETPPLGDLISQDGVRAIITTIHRRGWGVKEMLQQASITNVDQLETNIRQEITEYNNGNHNIVIPLHDVRLQNDPLLRIFIKIQVWGGRTGRYIFFRNGGLNWETVRPFYEDLIAVCTNQNSTIEHLKQAGITFHEQVDYLGIAFITKHIHFWTQVLPNGNSLPIFDSGMSDGFGFGRQPQWRHVDCYWEGMQQLFATPHGNGPWPNSMDSFERQLFQYFRANPNIH